MPEAARLRVRKEAFQPVRHELHRPAEEDARPDRGHLVGIGVQLDAERPADIGLVNRHVRLRETEVTADDVAELERRLRDGPDFQPARTGIEVGQDAARLHGHGGNAGKFEGLFHDDEARLCEGRCGVAMLHSGLECDIGVKLGMRERGPGADGGIQCRDRGQHLPIDAEPVAGILGFGPASCDHHGDGIALKRGAIMRQRILQRRPHTRRMAQDTPPRRADSVHVRAREDGNDARRQRGIKAVDVQDPRMRMRTAKKRGMKKTRARKIVQIPSATAGKPPRFGPWLAAADMTRSGRTAHSAASPTVCAAVTTASTMASYPVQRQ